MCGNLFIDFIFHHPRAFDLTFCLHQQTSQSPVGDSSPYQGEPASRQPRFTEIIDGKIRALQETDLTTG